MTTQQTKEFNEVDLLSSQESSEHHHHDGCCGHEHQHALPVTRGAVKLGRNDPCSCGSGKKHKKCCL